MFTALGSGLPETLSVPAFSGSVSSGQAPVWDIWLKDSTGDLLLVLVEGSTATAVAVITSGTCPSLSNGLSYLTGIPSTYVDSSTVLTNTQNAGGSAFVSAHSATYVEFSVVGGFTSGLFSSSASWTVQYTTCAPFGASGSPAGTEYSQMFSVYASNGTVYKNPGPTTVPSCSSSIGPTDLDAFWSAAFVAHS
jgi:hypothetical protein